MKILFLLIISCMVTFFVHAQNTPVFNGKQMIDASIVTWNFGTRPAGWYRIATIAGGSRGNATFELRENADHSTLRFELGINFNSSDGSSFAITNHSHYGAPTFTAIRTLTKSTYDDVYLEVYVNPHNNDNQSFTVYSINPMADGDWTLLNWTTGSIPSGYTEAQFATNFLFSVGNIPENNILSVNRSGNVLIGKTSQSNSTYKLDVAGKVRADEIVVNTTGADFVFEDGYKVRTLQELEGFIKTNKHLPDIPPAKTMQEEGVGVGELQTKLLQKIEELTLYIIEQDKRIRELESDKKKRK